MGQKNGKGTVSIVNDSKRIRLRWRYQTKRYSLSLFHCTKSNLQEAKRIALTIELDLIRHTLDPSLACYRTSSDTPLVNTTKTFIAHFEYWVKLYRNMDCDQDQDYWTVRNMLGRWGNFEGYEAVSLLGKENINGRTYNSRLSLLKAFYSWMAKQKIIAENAFDDVLRKKTKKATNNARDPLTLPGIQAILDAFKNDTYRKATSRYPGYLVLASRQSRTS